MAKTEIPRFMVCVGDAASSIESTADFIAIDIPVNDGRVRRGMLMFSTSDNAREFIATNPGEWHIRNMDRWIFQQFLIDPRNRSQFDCVVIDWMNNGKPSPIRCFDADAGAEALDGVDGDDDSRTVEFWQVLI